MSLHLKSVHVWCACQNYADLLGIPIVWIKENSSWFGADLKAGPVHVTSIA